MSTSLRIGFALTGSFCTHAHALDAAQHLVRLGHQLTPILSEHCSQLDTRFGTAETLRKRLHDVTQRPIIDSIVAAEPIGPHALFDVLVVAPCTGNTAAKLAHAITDTTVTMAVKSHLRIGRPVVLAISTNDALAGSAANIGTLLNRKHFFFVPMRQDAPLDKPNSLVAQLALLPDTIEAALAHRQLQPILYTP